VGGGAMGCWWWRLIRFRSNLPFASLLFSWGGEGL
jgi:hypothetical protein